MTTGGKESKAEEKNLEVTEKGFNCVTLHSSSLRSTDWYASLLSICAPCLWRFVRNLSVNIG